MPRHRALLITALLLAAACADPVTPLQTVQPPPPGGSQPETFSPAITVLPSAPAAGVPVTFTSTVQAGTAAQHDWDFGDGDTGTGASVQHAYQAPGSYTVVLTITDAGVTDTRITTVEVLGSAAALRR